MDKKNEICFKVCGALLFLLSFFYLVSLSFALPEFLGLLKQYNVALSEDKSAMLGLMSFLPILIMFIMSLRAAITLVILRTAAIKYTLEFFYTYLSLKLFYVLLLTGTSSMIGVLSVVDPLLVMGGCSIAFMPKLKKQVLTEQKQISAIKRINIFSSVFIILLLVAFVWMHKKIYSSNPELYKETKQFERVEKSYSALPLKQLLTDSYEFYLPNDLSLEADQAQQGQGQLIIRNDQGSEFIVINPDSTIRLLYPILSKLIKGKDIYVTYRAYLSERFALVIQLMKMISKHGQINELELNNYHAFVKPLAAYKDEDKQIAIVTLFDKSDTNKEFEIIYVCEEDKCDLDKILYFIDRTQIRN